MLCIYEKTTGHILFANEMISVEPSEYAIINITNVPKDKILVAIDANGIPIYEDKPLTVEDRLALLEASQNDQDEAITEIAEIISEQS